MRSNRSGSQLLGFRRAFVLMMVLAIINERAAVEKRLKVAWSGRLEMIAGRMVEALASVAIDDQGADEVIVRGQNGELLSGRSFRVRGGNVIAADFRLAEAV